VLRVPGSGNAKLTSPEAIDDAHQQQSGE